MLNHNKFVENDHVYGILESENWKDFYALLVFLICFQVEYIRLTQDHRSGLVIAWSKIQSSVAGMW